MGSRTDICVVFNAHRLSKDYEKTRRNSHSMVYLALIPVLIRRLG